MQTATNYSKQFAGWATALWARYESDLYFRTSANIVLLQALFVVLCAGAFALALLMPAQGWMIFGVTMLGALVAGIFLSRFTLRPARDTARYQKLFISNVAHELRTPLSTIKTSSEVSLLDDKLPAAHKRTFREIIEELNRISEIINNLLSLNTLTRPERMQFSTVDIAPLAEEVVRQHLPLSRERGIKLVIRKEPGALVVGNRAALAQIMQNLIKNALEYTPRNPGRPVIISLRPVPAADEAHKGMVLFAVADPGVGMEQEDLFHIFEPFYRADTSRNRHIKKSGSGLGLTIVNEMVRAHHGRIHIESQPRKGTTVSVYLPQGGHGSAGGSSRNDVHETSVDFSR